MTTTDALFALKIQEIGRRLGAGIEMLMPPAAGNGEIAQEGKKAATSEQTPANTLSKLPEKTLSTQPLEEHPNN